VGKKSGHGKKSKKRRKGRTGPSRVCQKKHLNNLSYRWHLEHCHPGEQSEVWGAKGGEKKTLECKERKKKKKERGTLHVTRPMRVIPLLSNDPRGEHWRARGRRDRGKKVEKKKKGKREDRTIPETFKFSTDRCVSWSHRQKTRR